MGRDVAGAKLLGDQLPVKARFRKEAAEVDHHGKIGELKPASIAAVDRQPIGSSVTRASSAPTRPHLLCLAAITATSLGWKSELTCSVTSAIIPSPAMLIMARTRVRTRSITVWRKVSKLRQPDSPCVDHGGCAGAKAEVLAGLHAVVAGCQIGANPGGMEQVSVHVDQTGV